MKPAAVILLLALSLAVLVALAGDRYPVNLPGRYQLTAATVQVMAAVPGNIRPISNPELFRIDTTTGQTWRLFLFNDGTNNFAHWTPIPNP